MVYIPEKRTFRLFIPAILFVLSAALVVLLAYFTKSYFTYIPAVLLLLFFAAQSLFSYAVFEYSFVIEDGGFAIYRRFSQNKRKIFDLDLKRIQKVLPYKEAKKHLKKVKPKPRRFYCLCGQGRKNAVALIYENGWQSHVIFIAASPEFKTALENYGL